MNHSLYPDAPVPVREDLATAHERTWRRLAAPGAWWDGAARVAIGAEVRRARGCALCTKRKAALSPYAVRGEHDRDGVLPLAAVEVVHRVTTDPQRLARKLLDDVRRDGITTEQYVELIAVTTAVISVDAFCRALGATAPPLPEPLPGEPSRRRPAGTMSYEAWVPMLAKPSGPDADLFHGFPGGFAPNVVRALSLVPDELRDLRSLGEAEYLPFDQAPNFGAARALTRPQTELIAARVSALNECFY